MYVSEVFAICIFNVKYLPSSCFWSHILYCTDISAYWQLLLCGYNTLKMEAGKLSETLAIQPSSIFHNNRAIKSKLQLNLSEMLKLQ